MEASILTSTKKILGISEDLDVFDLDILTHINSTFSHLHQLGIGPAEIYSIEDASAEWGDFEAASNQLPLVRTYMYLKVRMLFDPPTTSFLLDALRKVIEEHEHRLVLAKEIASLSG